MKRTIEIVLTAIGLLFSLIGLVVTTFLVFFTNTDIVRNNFEEGFRESAMEGGGQYSAGEADMLLNFAVGFGWIILSALFIGLVLGLIAIFFYAGNKKPKAASILMIIAAVVVALGTIFIGFVPALLFLVAGIVGLVRKTPVNPEVTDA